MKQRIEYIDALRGFSGLYACSSVCIRRLMWNK